jgi:hypothetical protein
MGPYTTAQRDMAIYASAHRMTAYILVRICTYLYILVRTHRNVRACIVAYRNTRNMTAYTPQHKNLTVYILVHITKSTSIDFLGGLSSSGIRRGVNGQLVPDVSRYSVGLNFKGIMFNEHLTLEVETTRLSRKDANKSSSDAAAYPTRTRTSAVEMRKLKITHRIQELRKLVAPSALILV